MTSGPSKTSDHKAVDHSAIFVRKCVVSDAGYFTQKADTPKAVLEHSITDVDTNDLLDLLIASVVNIRTSQEKREAEVAARDSEQNEDLYDLYDYFGSGMVPTGRRSKESYAELLIPQTNKPTSTTIADYIDICSRKGISFADGTKIGAVLSFCYEDNNPAVAGQAFRCGNTLILSLPENPRAADSCVQMLIINTESGCYLSELSKQEEDITGTTETWTITYQQVFDRLFEVAPFVDPISPGTPFAVQMIPNKDAKYCSAPCLLRDRTTNELLAWVREGKYEEDLAVIHNKLAAAREKLSKEREFYRRESAWEMIQWLASEELTHEYNLEGRAILADEVGPERAEAIWDAAKTIASLFPLFLVPCVEQTL